jgi:tRNA 2-selenouridine synthase
VSVQPIAAADAMHRLAQFDTIIDARSPAEFADDRLPGAENWPVLDDDERRAVGTEYRQVSAFDARKQGAALVARRIADHIETRVRDKARDWKPLVYCWRGGKRSGTLAWFLGEIGFHVRVLDGGYKAFRTAVIGELDALPARYRFRVVCGKTGSGKTRLLGALAEAGAQVLDLEGLARHRGSVLGAVPGQAQPTQKAFETQVWHALSQLSPQRPVFVESESRKIGNLHVPEGLIARMREHGQCVVVELPDAARVRLLLDEYGHFRADTEAFCRQLDALVELRGRATVREWQQLARDGRWAEVFLDLMHRHYDPTYLRSIGRNFRNFDRAFRLELDDESAPALRSAAQRLLAVEAPGDVAHGPQ